MPPRFAAVAVACLACACGARALERPPGPPDEDGRPSAAHYYDLGCAAAARGDATRAEQYLSLAIDRGYDAGRALPVLLGVCLRSSHLRAALNHAEPYLRDHPEKVELRYLVASIYAGLGAPERAEGELERILRNDPRHARAHYLLATLDADGGATAASHLRRYLELEPDGEHAAEARSRLEELEP